MSGLSSRAREERSSTLFLSTFTFITIPLCEIVYGDLGVFSGFVVLWNRSRLLEARSLIFSINDLKKFVKRSDTSLKRIPIAFGEVEVEGIERLISPGWREETKLNEFNSYFSSLVRLKLFVIVHVPTKTFSPISIRMSSRNT